MFSSKKNKSVFLSIRPNFVLIIDLAIGAPWGGPDGNGAVFIYNVRDGKLANVPSQVRRFVQSS